MMPRWEKSEGATFEHDNAKKRGMGVHFIEIDEEISRL